MSDRTPHELYVHAYDTFTDDVGEHWFTAGMTAYNKAGEPMLLYVAFGRTEDEMMRRLDHITKLLNEADPV